MAFGFVCVSLSSSGKFISFSKFNFNFNNYGRSSVVESNSSVSEYCLLVVTNNESLFIYVNKKYIIAISPLLLLLRASMIITKKESRALPDLRFRPEFLA